MCLCYGEGAALDEGFPAAAQSTALRAACPMLAAGCAAGAAAGRPGLSCRAGPCCAPGAVCRGRDSAACQAQHSAARGAAQGAAGRRVGGRSPPARQGRAGQGRGLLLPQLLPGAGGSQLHCMPECFQGHFARVETRQGFSFSFTSGRERVVDRILKGAVKYEHISENPELYISHSAVI